MALNELKFQTNNFHPFIISASDIGNGDGSDFRMEVLVNGRVVFDLNFNVSLSGQIRKKHDEIKVEINSDEFPVISGDIKFMFHSSNSVRFA